MTATSPSSGKARVHTDARRTGPRGVAILGWYGSQNIGDEALLAAVSAALMKRGLTRLCALSINPDVTSARFGLSSAPRSLLSLKTWQALRGSRALVLGGGGLIQDRTSAYNLPLYAMYVVIARLLGLRVIGWGLGVEPLDTLLGRLLARYIVRSCDHFSVRDAGAKRLLTAVGCRAESIRVTADPAFLLEPAAVATPSDVDTGRPLAVFCLRELPDNRPGLNANYLLPISVRRKLGMLSKGGDARTTRFVEAIAAGVAAVCERGADALFVSFWPGRDDEVARRVIEAAVARGVQRERLHLAPAEQDPKRVAGLVGLAKVVYSMRLHALVFAALQGIPGVGLAYARKVRGLQRALGQEAWVIEVETRTPSPEEVAAKLTRAWDERDTAGVGVAAAAGWLRARAEGEADEIARLIVSARGRATG